MNSWKGLSIVLGVFAAVFIVLAVAVFEGFMPISLTDNLTSGELGVIGFLFIVGAVGAYAAEDYLGE